MLEKINSPHCLLKPKSPRVKPNNIIFFVFLYSELIMSINKYIEILKKKRIYGSPLIIDIVL